MAKQEVNTQQDHCHSTSENLIKEVVWKCTEVIANVFQACNTILGSHSKQPGDW